MKDVNIKEIHGKEHEERRLQFKVKINDGSLEIKFFWAGKGSLYNPPGLNWPLISAVSITRGRKRKLQYFSFCLLKNPGFCCSLHYRCENSLSLGWQPLFSICVYCLADNHCFLYVFIAWLTTIVFNMFPEKNTVGKLRWLQ